MNFFIAPFRLKEGVIRSQLLNLTNQLNQYNNDNYILINANEKYRLEDKYTNIIYYSNLKDELRKNKNDLKFIYTRSIFDFLKVFFAKKINNYKYKIIFDFRGLAYAESFLRNNSKIRSFILLIIEKFAYRKADIIHCVSNSFQEYLVEKFGNRNIKVIPCSVTKNHRKNNKNNSLIKFLYLGGISKWQNYEKTLILYKKIEFELKNCSLTIISNDIEQARKIIINYDIKNFEIKSLKHEEVINELPNYDYGFLLRDNILLNNVSSPIKFIEYISQGVIPIVSKGVGDYSTLVENEKIGIIVDMNKLQIDSLILKNLYQSDEIYEKLYNVSNKYLWKNTTKNFFNDY
ncbi:MAG: glycosyltransferase [Bacteroidales bacterium]|nr:glycosyltransferase [Bacteroidales bacterium]